jgi:vacuolar-type H+-ATPase subunit E/Vma4
MNNYNTPTFIEMLKAQIQEEQCRYRNAMISGKEFVELKLIKKNIEKLETSLQQVLQMLHDYIPYSSKAKK